MSKGLTKKELKRFSKSQLVNICKEHGIECGRKDLKTDLVNRVFKNKGLRSKLKAPEKRKPSAAQLRARQAFAERARKGKKPVIAQETPQLPRPSKRGKKPFVPNPPLEVDEEDVDKSIGEDIGLGRVSTVKRKITQAPPVPKPFVKPAPKKVKKLAQKKPVLNEEADSARVRPPKPVAALSKPVRTRNVVDPTASNKAAPPVSFYKPEGRSQSDVAEKTPVMRMRADFQRKEKQIKGSVPIIEQEFRDNSAGRLIATDYKFSNVIKRRSDKNAKLLLREFNRGDIVELDKRRTHTSELLQRINTNARSMGVRHREYLDGNNKTTDAFDRYLKSGQRHQARKLMEDAVRRTERRAGQEFQGGITELDAELELESEDPKSQILEELLRRRDDERKGLVEEEKEQEREKGREEIRGQLFARELQTNEEFVNTVKGSLTGQKGDVDRKITNPNTGRQIAVNGETFRKQFAKLTDEQKEEVNRILSA